MPSCFFLLLLVSNINTADNLPSSGFIAWTRAFWSTLVTLWRLLFHLPSSVQIWDGLYLQGQQTLVRSRNYILLCVHFLWKRSHFFLEVSVLAYTKKLQSTRSLFGACFLEPLSQISSGFEVEVAEPLRMTMIGIKADLFKRCFQDSIRNSDLPESEKAEIFKRVFQTEGSFPHVTVRQSPGLINPKP